ncbi:hypothetical protein [Paenibacillus sp. 1P03SA]|uniref:hypothetical protein n=1 Tax=Paenibacillus sp. 1P03SA TaxID=3132294 RepID=UPI0039A0CC42
MRKKLSLAVIAALSVVTLSSAASATINPNDNALASFANTNVTPSTITVVSDPKGKPNASVTFVDPALKDSGNKTIVPNGDVYEVYDRSTYSDAGTTIVNYNVGPREKDVFLTSVPKGGTSTISGSRTVSASLQISGNYNANIASVVKWSVSGNATGSFSYTWTNSKVYTAPESVPFHRDYYGAVQYDEYSTRVNKVDIYKQYNGSKYVGEVQYNQGVVNTVISKKPKAIEYSIDF